MSNKTMGFIVNAYQDIPGAKFKIGDEVRVVNSPSSVGIIIAINCVEEGVFEYETDSHLFLFWEDELELINHALN